MAPPLTAAERFVPLPAPLEQVGADRRPARAAGLLGALKGKRNHDVPTGYLLRQLFIVLLPALLFAAGGAVELPSVTRVAPAEAESGLQQIGAETSQRQRRRPAGAALPAGCRNRRPRRPAGTARGGRSGRAAGRRSGASRARSPSHRAPSPSRLPPSAAGSAPAAASAAARRHPACTRRLLDRPGGRRGRAAACSTAC